MSIFLKVFSFVSLLSLMTFANLTRTTDIQSQAGSRNVKQTISTDLSPLPEAKDLLIRIAKTLESPELNQAIQGSHALQILKDHLKVDLYHLNLSFEIEDKSYPYDAPVESPFPLRPTLEAINNAILFFNTVSKSTTYKTELTYDLLKYPEFKRLHDSFKKNSDTQSPEFISERDLIANPVEGYVKLRDRLRKHGETASFPEFETTVTDLIASLNSNEMAQFTANDSGLAHYCEIALKELRGVLAERGKSTRIYPEFSNRLPYRRTIQAIERGLRVLDIKERIKYAESSDWHEVEASWYNGSEPKLLPLYHFNRYKYYMSPMQSEADLVLFPTTSELSMEDLIRVRSVPIGFMGVQDHTSRADRHHNSPLDYWYHDINHIRRMWYYDLRKKEKEGLDTDEKLVASYRERQKFIEKLLDATAPTTVSRVQNEIRKQQRMLIFETFHETALPADANSLLRDLNRGPATPQPFEVQVQEPIHNLEAIRTFDGNLKSGSDKLPLDLSEPTVVRYFFDRAPGFLANNDNKIRWGFHDSTFNPDTDFAGLHFRKPIFLAQAANGLFKLLGDRSHSYDTLLKHINDRRGQPELYRYYKLDPERRPRELNRRRVVIK